MVRQKGQMITWRLLRAPEVQGKEELLVPRALGIAVFAP